MYKRDREDEELITELYKQYSPFLKKKIQSKITDAYAAEDIIQDIFISLMRNIDVLQVLTTEQRICYFNKAANSRMANYFRDLSQRKKEEENIIPFYENECNDRNILPELCVEAKELESICRKLCMEISEQELRIVNLRYEKQLSYKEISQITGISEKSVGVKIQRINKKLLKKMKSMDEMEGYVR